MKGEFASIESISQHNFFEVASINISIKRQTFRQQSTLVRKMMYGFKDSFNIATNCGMAFVKFITIACVLI